ncbi:MAG: FGGY-family carbohydrate kinase [Acetobacteraceae bacterium]
MPSGPSEHALVGIDAGTSGIRAVLIDAEAQPLATVERPMPWAKGGAGPVTLDPDLLWQETCAALQSLARPGIVGIAAASFGESAVLIDRAGEPVAPAIAWFDRCTEGEMDGLVARHRAEALYAASGLPPDPTYQLPKLLWMRAHAPGFSRAVRVLNVADWIALRLCGEAATDFSLASRTLALDLARGGWNDALLEAEGLAHLPAPLLPSGTRIGTVSPRAAAESGLPPGAAVGVGAHDHIAGALAAGTIAPGILLDSLGTAEALLRTLPQPIADPAALAGGFAQGAIRVAPGDSLNYALGAIPVSGGAVEWLRSATGSTAHATLIAEGSAVPAGSDGVVFVPHLAAAAAPEPDSAARGALLGLTPQTSRGVLYRAVLEGLAHQSRLIIDAMERLPGVTRAHEIRLIGGGVRNPLFLDIKADVIGRELAVMGEVQSAALGAALLAGIAAGVWPDIKTASSRTSQPAFHRVPGANVPLYAARHAALASLHRSLSRIYRLPTPAHSSSTPT